MSVHRLKQPHIIPIGDRAYRLGADYFYYWTEGQIVYRLKVPVNFIHDGASVPRLAWTATAILPDGLLRAAALVHDFLYEYRGRLPSGLCEYSVNAEKSWRGSERVFTRKEADDLFLRIMEEAGVSSLKRTIAYKAVRLAGWTYWD